MAKSNKKINILERFFVFIDKFNEIRVDEGKIKYTIGKDGGIHVRPSDLINSKAIQD